jgi:hypothetical protein
VPQLNLLAAAFNCLAAYSDSAVVGDADVGAAATGILAKLTAIEDVCASVVERVNHPYPSHHCSNVSSWLLAGHN